MISSVYAYQTLPIYVRPLTLGTITPNTAFNYVFNFTTDVACSNVVYNSGVKTITTDSYGIGYVEIDIGKLNTTPKYMCEYKGNSLRKVHNISAGLSANKMIKGNLTVNGTSNFGGDLLPMTTLIHDIGSGPLRWRNLYISNISADAIDATDNITTLTSFHGSGAYLTGTDGLYVFGNVTLNGTMAPNLTITDGTYSVILSATTIYSNTGYAPLMQLGMDANATGNYAVAIGLNSAANATSAVAIGNLAWAYDTEGMAFGSGATAYYRALALGYQASASGDYSSAMGLTSYASGEGATAIGYQVRASGDKSLVMGSYSYAEGYSSVSIGIRTNSSGNYSFALGSYITVEGNNSYGFGRSGLSSKDDTFTLHNLNLNMTNNNITDVDTIYVYNISGRSPIGMLSDVDMYKDLSVNQSQFYVDSSKGYVGINQNNPQYALDVVGSGSFSDDNSLYIAKKITHIGDVDTWIEYTDDTTSMYAGNILMFRLAESATQDEVIVNDFTLDLDFRVESDNMDDAFLVDASKDEINMSVPLNINNNTLITETLNVTSDFSVNQSQFFVDASQGNVNVSGNLTAENVFWPVYISSHTNNTIPVAVAGTWYNVTFDHEDETFKRRITHTATDKTNHTFTIQDTGVYEITYTMVFEDSAAVPTSHIVTRIIKNGVEINGFTIEEDLGIQNKDSSLHHSDLVELVTNDEIVLQFTSDDITVSLSAHLTYGTHKNTGHLTIKRIA